MTVKKYRYLLLTLIVTLLVAYFFYLYRVDLLWENRYATDKRPHYIVVTSDVHLSAPGGRWPFTTDQFKNFLSGLREYPPDLIFVAGDIIDNAVQTSDGVTAGNEAHWNREIDIYKSFSKYLDSTRFLQSYGPGHDYGNLNLIQSKIGPERGSYQWGKYQLVWLTVKKGSFSNEAKNYSNGLTSFDYIWLTNQLSTNQHVILLFHIPLRTKTTYQYGKWSNNSNLTIDPEDPIYKIINRYSDHISAIFNGHIHYPIKSEYNKIPLYICPFIKKGCHCTITATGSLIKVEHVDCENVITDLP